MKKQSISKPNSEKNPPENNESAPPTVVVTQEMAFYCFDVLISKLNHLPPPQISNIPNTPNCLFVTWKKLPDLSLRGCIGTFAPLPLRDGLQKYALESALRDTRFSPINPNEIKQLQVTVSLLTNFEKGKDYLDWTLGVHGIQIEFSDGGSKKSATFLPQVATEQGWDQIKTIDALLQKGGFEGKVTKEIRESIKLTRYRSEIVSVSYEEYSRIRHEQNQSVFKS